MTQASNAAMSGETLARASAATDSAAHPPQRSGLAIPYGAPMVAAAGAGAFGLIGLLVPIQWIESAAYQLYLDMITPAAVPPFGFGARAVAVLLLVLLGAGIGYALARVFRVTSSTGSLSDLVQRLRGIGKEDDADAPALRSADRHPDAPARRPFSAAREIPIADDAITGAAAAPATAPFTEPLTDIADDDDDELVLDAHFADNAEATALAPQSDQSVDWEALRQDVPLSSQPSDDAASFPAPPNAEPDYDLLPPALDDWETHSVEATPSPSAPVSESAPASVARESHAVVEPLDLSAARLDQLLARLEAGLAHRQTAPTTSSDADGVPSQSDAASRTSPVDQAPTLADAPSDERPAQFPTANDPAFPQDPALAAALATLRRLNQKAS